MRKIMLEGCLIFRLNWAINITAYFDSLDSVTGSGCKLTQFNRFTTTATMLEVIFIKYRLALSANLRQL